jgi:hypothetical protein
VKPQSHSSATKRWWASARVISVAFDDPKAVDAGDRETHGWKSVW